jgi:hypothetical protein
MIHVPSWVHEPHGRRRGVALLWALIVVTVLTVMLALITTEFLAARRVADRRHNQVQSAWLARAGVELAAARLLDNPTGYSGESVTLLPESEIRIDVRAGPEAPDTFVVTSEARYPKTGSEMVLRSITRRLRRVQEKDRVHIEGEVAEPAK